MVFNNIRKTTFSLTGLVALALAGCSRTSDQWKFNDYTQPQKNIELHVDSSSNQVQQVILQNQNPPVEYFPVQNPLRPPQETPQRVPKPLPQTPKLPNSTPKEPYETPKIIIEESPEQVAQSIFNSKEPMKYSMLIMRPKVYSSPMPNMIKNPKKTIPESIPEQQSGQDTEKWERVRPEGSEAPLYSLPSPEKTSPQDSSKTPDPTVPTPGTSPETRYRPSLKYQYQNRLDYNLDPHPALI